jgi:hypothetical protein
LEAVGVPKRPVLPVALIVQNVSFGLKPNPATPTACPCDTVAGFSTTRAEGVPTVKTPAASFPLAGCPGVWSFT